MIRIVAIAALIATPALAAPCRDAKGHFTPCTSTTAVKTTSTTTTSQQVTKDSKGRCHVASGPKKGQYTKCPA